MKHTDFFQRTKEIKEQEKFELLEAITAHGGEFCWDEDEEKPIITIETGGVYSSPVNVELEKVLLCGDGQLALFGADDDGNDYEFPPEHVIAGELSAIIDCLPDTESVSDVSKKQEFFAITPVSRQIAEDRGLYEVIFDISQCAYEITKSGKYDSRMIMSEVIRWSKEFNDKYPAESWCNDFANIDYYETIHSFATDKIKEFINDHGN
jgi:hypothetical protein